MFFLLAVRLNSHYPEGYVYKRRLKGDVVCQLLQPLCVYSFIVDTSWCHIL